MRLLDLDREPWRSSVAMGPGRRGQGDVRSAFASGHGVAQLASPAMLVAIEATAMD
jgi:hypothetical protein